MLASVPANARVYPKDGKSLIDPERLRGAQPSPFAYGKNYHDWPIYRYNINQGAKPYRSEEVHSWFPQPGAQRTAVGGVWTWITESYSPFKTGYLCFDARAPLQIEQQFAVPSGAGWHRVGDPAETIINTLEGMPLLMAQGVSNRPGMLQPPFGGFAWGLADSASVRWLRPDEAFITPQGDYHWYPIQFDREVCIELWIHPCVPSGFAPAFMPCV